MLRAVLLVAVASVTAGAAPHGRVVRVERSFGGRTGTPRFCVIGPGNAPEGYCLGKRPEPDDRLVALDDRHVVATLRITSANAYGDCAEAAQWHIRAGVETGELVATGVLDATTFAVLDVPLDVHSARLLKPVHGPAKATVDDIIAAVDANGDGEPDVEFLKAACDGTTPSSRDCIEVWSVVNHRFELVRTEHPQACH